MENYIISSQKLKDKKMLCELQAELGGCLLWHKIRWSKIAKDLKTNVAKICYLLHGKRAMKKVDYDKVLLLDLPENAKKILEKMKVFY